MTKFFFGLAIAILFSGCGVFSKQVEPFDRGYLSLRSMEIGTDTAESEVLQHTYNAREGSVGGFGSAGGGCGCN